MKSQHHFLLTLSAQSRRTGSKPQVLPSPGKSVEAASIRQQAPVVKTKEVCLRREAVSPVESPAQARTQGGREFIREQGCKEAVRRTATRRSRAKNDLAIQTSYEKGALQGNAAGGSLQSSPPDIQASTPPLGRRKSQHRNGTALRTGLLRVRRLGLL